MTVKVEISGDAVYVRDQMRAMLGIFVDNTGDYAPEPAAPEAPKARRGRPPKTPNTPPAAHQPEPQGAASEPEQTTAPESGPSEVSAKADEPVAPATVVDEKSMRDSLLAVANKYQGGGKAGMDAASKIIGEHGYTKVKDIKPADYAAIKEKADKLMASA